MKPTMRSELEPLAEAALLDHLAKNPGDLRRPIILKGSEVIAGFNAEAQARLGVPSAKPPPAANERAASPASRKKKPTR